MEVLLDGAVELPSLVAFAQSVFEFGACDRRFLPAGRDQPPEILAHTNRDLFVVESRKADDHCDRTTVSCQ
jgi:hypothetical protein